MKIYSILENQKQFKEKYKEFLFSNEGLGHIISKKRTSLIFLGFLFSIAIMLSLYILVLLGLLLSIFTFPIILVVLIVFFIPMLLLIRKNFLYRSISRNSLNFLKAKEKLDIGYAVMIYNDSKYLTMLGYSKNTTIETIAKEQGILMSLVKKGSRLDYMKIKNIMDKSEHNFIGNLYVTNYSDHKVHTYKVNNVTYYQISMKPSVFKTHVATGIIDGSYFYPFPSTVWPSERVK